LEEGGTKMVGFVVWGGILPCVVGRQGLDIALEQLMPLDRWMYFCSLAGIVSGLWIRYFGLRDEKCCLVFRISAPLLGGAWWSSNQLTSLHRALLASGRHAILSRAGKACRLCLIYNLQLYLDLLLEV